MPHLLEVRISPSGREARFSEDVSPELATSMATAILSSDRSFQETRDRIAEYGPMDLEEGSNSPSA